MRRIDSWIGTVGYGFSFAALSSGDEVLKLLGTGGLTVLYGRHCLADLRQASASVRRWWQVAGRMLRPLPRTLGRWIVDHRAVCVTVTIAAIGGTASLIDVVAIIESPWLMIHVGTGIVDA